MTLASLDARTVRFRGGLASLTILFLGLTLPTQLWSLRLWQLDSWWWPLAPLLILLAVGLAAIIPLGRGALRESLAGRSRSLWLLLGAGTATAEYIVVRQFTPLLAQAADTQMLSCFLALDVVLLGPIVEELVHRGVMWQACRRLMGPRWSILVTSAVFALYHGPERIADFPGLFVGGVILGWLRHRSGSLHPCFVGHSVYNGLVTCHF